MIVKPTANAAADQDPDQSIPDPLFAAYLRQYELLEGAYCPDICSCGSTDCYYKGCPLKRVKRRRVGGRRMHIDGRRCKGIQVDLIARFDRSDAMHVNWELSIDDDPDLLDEEQLAAMPQLVFWAINELIRFKQNAQRSTHWVGDPPSSDDS